MRFVFQIAFALNSIGTHWDDGMSALRRSAEKKGMLEPDTRTEKQKQVRQWSGFHDIDENHCE